MEFEVLSEEVEWESNRVAAAFGVKEWGEDNSMFNRDPEAICFGGLHGSHMVRWQIGGDDEIKAELDFVNVGDDDWPRTHLAFNDVLNINDEPLPGELELMARGLYRLGFENDNLLARLPQLTAHEKLELRLSMPRKFWPQKWTEEEANNGAAAKWGVTNDDTLHLT